MNYSKSLQSKTTDSKIFYGWIIVAATFLIATITYGIQYTFGVFFEPLFKEFGWTRATTAGVFTTYLVVHAIFSFIMGGICDKWGPRKTIAVGGILMGLGIMLASQTQTIWHLYLSYGVLVGIGCSAYVPLVTTVSRWFDKKRGLAVGIVAAGVGTGTMALPPLAEHFIITYNWRVSYMIIAVIAWIIILSCSFLLKREPQEMGLLPDGLSVPVNPDLPDADNSHHVPSNGEWTLKEAFYTRTFWITVFIMTFVCFGLFILMTHIVAYAIDIGVNKMAAAGIFGVMGGTSIAGRITFGIVSDNFGVKKTFIISITGQTIMVFWLQISSNLPMLYCFAVVFGFFYGGLSPLWPKLFSEYFGLISLGKILGFAIMAGLIGGAMGPVVGGYIHDITGSYDMAFLISAFAFGFGLFFSFFLKTPVNKQLCE